MYLEIVHRLIHIAALPRLTRHRLRLQRCWRVIITPLLHILHILNHILQLLDFRLQLVNLVRLVNATASILTGRLHGITAGAKGLEVGGVVGEDLGDVLQLFEQLLF